VEAARLTLLLELGELWDEIVSKTPQPQPRTRRPQLRGRQLVAAVIVIAAGALAIVLATGGSKKKAAVAAPTTPAATTTVAPTTTVARPKPKPRPKPVVKPEPKLSPVKAVFEESQRATFYTESVTVAGQGTPTYTWRLSPPKDNPACNDFAPVLGSPNEAVWHHADTDGCRHNGIQHDGTVYVTVTTNDWVCTQSFFGTLTRTGSSAQTCKQR